MITEIVPGSGWQGINVRELWQFRELLYFLVWRDVKVRYKQTVLGVAWAVLQPALMMLVFTVFLGVMAKVPSANDPVFVFAGILPWTFFASAMTNAANSLVNSERLITKVYFPRLGVPLAAVGAAILDFAIASVLLFVMLMVKGVSAIPNLPMIVVSFGVLAVAAAGVGTLLSALTVAYRDFRYLVPFLAQFWLFATPTAYSRVPDDASPLLKFLITANPISGLIASFRAAVFGEQIPWNLFGPAVALSILFMVVGCFYFRRVEDTFSDIV